MITPTDSSNLQFHDPEYDQVRLTSMSMSVPASAQTPISMLDDLLRGRWKIAIVLGILLAFIFSVAGFVIAPVRFSSTGRIHVAPTGSAILNETQETGNLQGYIAVLGTQAQFVMSARVIDLALRDPEVSLLPFASNLNAREVISSNLTAKAIKGTELIAVTYEANSPEEAQLVLNAVLVSYEQFHGHNAGNNLLARLDRLRDEQKDWQRKRTANRQETRDFIEQSENGASDLSEILRIKLEKREELRQTIAGIDLEIAMLGMNDNSSGDSTIVTIAEPLIEELEIIDPDLSALRRQYLDLEVELEQLKEKYHGVMTHQVLVSAVRNLENMEKTIANRIEAAIERWDSAGGALPINSNSLGRKSLDQLTKQRTLISEMLVKAKSELRQLNEDQNRLVDLTQKENDTNEYLEELSSKIDILRLESNPEMFSGRIEIEKGSKSLGPSKDKRIQLAVAGFIGGFGFSLGLFILLGLLDQKAFSSSQLRHDESKYRCLGVLPDLANGSLDPAHAEVAVHCVHQIRNRIEAHRPQTSNFVLLVTSPQQGDGKTSLAMVLASSYAYAGYSTLLIDCDLVGMDVTKQHDLLQHQGLREVLSGEMGVDQVTKVVSSNLDVIGAGLDPHFGPESVRRDEFAAMCSGLRLSYDIIIIDSGPFIGSVELLPIATSVDSVVLAFRRGRSRKRLQECIADLNSLGVRIIGVVLNRAVSSDCDHYVSYSVISERRLIITDDVAQVGESNSQSESPENVLLHAMKMSHEGEQESIEKK